MMWKDTYKLGIETIDAQHRELFGMAGRLLHAVEDGKGAQEVGQAVAFLKEYVVKHFRDEEAYQASIQYKGLAEHRALHQGFARKVSKYEQKLEGSGYDDRVVKDFTGLVAAWLIYHVMDADQKIAGAAPEEPVHPATGTDCLRESVCDVLEKMAGLPRADFKEHPCMPGKEDVVIAVPLIGDLKGQAVFAYSRDLAFGLIEAMTFTKVDEVDGLVLSALCEVSNIASGNMATLLAQKGVSCDIGTPEIQHSEPPAADDPAFAVCGIKTALGRLQAGIYR